MAGYCQDRTVIITGAGGGLGHAYALALGAEGANVVVNDINAETAQATVDAIIAAGGKAIVNLGDITSYDAAFDIVKSAIDEFGDLQAVVNNAGNNRDRMFTSLSEMIGTKLSAFISKGIFVSLPTRPNIGVSKVKRVKPSTPVLSIQVQGRGFRDPSGRRITRRQRAEF